jgi:glycerophosphoryl diester phosphodiesterase
MRPLVISHAACGGHAPHNTLAGIRKAIELGSDAIEIDVQVTADGVPVLMHDLTVDRTTNGSGAVKELTLSEMQKLDAGGEPPPALSQVIELTLGTVLLVIEMKAQGIGGHIARTVHEHGALNHVMAWSFFPDAIEDLRRHEPRIPCGLLVGGEYMDRWPAMRDKAISLGAQAVSLFNPAVNAEIRRDTQRHGLALYTWTPDSLEEIARLIALEVDGICSNYPDRVVRLLSA